VALDRIEAANLDDLGHAPALLVYLDMNHDVD
jgi:hypothetical protein